MPSLRSNDADHCATYLDRLSEFAVAFADPSENKADCLAEFEEYWSQIEHAQQWAARETPNDANAAHMAHQFASYCADSGDQLIEIYRSQALRVDWLNDGLIAAEKLQNDKEVAGVAYNLGVVLVSMDRLDEAKPLIDRAMAYFETKDDKSDVIAGLNVRGLIANRENDHAESIHQHLSAYEISKDPKYESKHSSTLRFLASAYTAAGDGTKAEEYYREALPIFKKLNNLKSFVEAIINIARLRLNEDTDDSKQEAHSLCDSALAIFEDPGLPIDGQLLHHRVGALMLDLAHPLTEEFVVDSLEGATTAKNLMLEGCMRQLLSLVHLKSGKLEDAFAEARLSKSAFSAIAFSHGVDAADNLLEALDQHVTPPI